MWRQKTAQFQRRRTTIFLVILAKATRMIISVILIQTSMKIPKLARDNKQTSL